MAPHWCHQKKTAGKKGRGKGKPPAKKKNKRGTRSAKATAKRESQAKRLAAAQERLEEEESSSAADPEARGSAEAKGRSQPSRRVVLTYSKKEAEERDRILSTRAPKSKARRHKKKKKEKEEKRARPEITLRSVPREAQANRVLSSPQRMGLVDTRQLGKPEVFKGSTEENFSDWSFIFESYLSCIDNRYISLLEQAKFSRNSMPNRALSEADTELSCQLYYILVMLLRGRPLDIAYNSGMGEGLESYRRIFEEFHPRVASRYVGTLTTLLSSKFGDDVEGDLAAFEKSVRRYEQESGKTLDEEMLLGIVVNGLKDTTLQSHIIRNSSRLKSFSDVKTELLEISRTNRVLQNLPQPMDLGAAPWKKE